MQESYVSQQDNVFPIAQTCCCSPAFCTGCGRTLYSASNDQ